RRLSPTRPPRHPHASSGGDSGDSERRRTGGDGRHLPGHPCRGRVVCDAPTLARVPRESRSGVRAVDAPADRGGRCAHDVGPPCDSAHAADGGPMTRRTPSTTQRRNWSAAPNPSSGTPRVDGLEERVLAFAEQLGRIAGTVQAKTAGWMDGDALKKDLARVRDGAADLLHQLTADAPPVAVSRPTG